MDKKKVEWYEEILKEKREELLEEIKGEDMVEDFGDDVDSSDEEADEAEAFGNKVARTQSLKEDLAEVEAALRKVKEGSYGVCDACHKDIEENVLEAAPESLLCRKCKKP